MSKLVCLMLILAPVVAAAGSYNEGKGATHDCAKDADVAINIDGGTFTFKGACQQIAVNGNDNKITIDQVGRLSVNGNGNTITANQITALSTNGNKNKVNYGKTKPKASDLGTGNQVTGGGGAAKPAQPDKPAADEPAAGGTVDCKKHPTYSVSGNGRQSLKFTGTCDKITVETGENSLKIENVKTLQLDGGMNSVEVGGVDAIVTNGGQNTVAYKKGLSGAKPKISGGGAGNKVAQVK